MEAIPSLGRQHDMQRPSLDLRPRRPAAHAGDSSNARRPSKRASVRSRHGRGSTPDRTWDEWWRGPARSAW